MHSQRSMIEEFDPWLWFVATYTWRHLDHSSRPPSMYHLTPSMHISLGTKSSSNPTCMPCQVHVVDKDDYKNLHFLWPSPSNFFGAFDLSLFVMFPIHSQVCLTSSAIPPWQWAKVSIYSKCSSPMGQGICPTSALPKGQGESPKLFVQHVHQCWCGGGASCHCRWGSYINALL